MRVWAGAMRKETIANQLAMATKQLEDDVVHLAILNAGLERTATLIE
jgi:hypothetical protein